MHRCRIRYDDGMIQVDAAGTAPADVLFHLDRTKLNNHLAACRLTNLSGRHYDHDGHLKNALDNRDFRMRHRQT
jgi:hypothetical protein